MFCNTEKAWLSQHNIPFIERNVVEDQSAMAELERLEVFSTPATLVDDQLVVGFNRKKLGELLAISGPGETVPPV